MVWALSSSAFRGKSTDMSFGEGRPKGNGARKAEAGEQSRIFATKRETLAAMLPQMTKPKSLAAKYA
jgi:hypothetical protein